MKNILSTFSAVIIISSGGLSAKDLNKADVIIDSILSEQDSKGSNAGPSEKQAEGKAAKKKGGSAKQGKDGDDNGGDRLAMKNAVALFNSGMYDEALEASSGISSSFPQSRLTDANRILAGRIYLKKFQPEKAAAEFSQIKETSGEYPAALFYAAETERLSGKKIKASASYLKAAAVNPGGSFAPSALLTAARIQLELKNGEAAAEITVRLIRNYPDRDTIDDAYFLLAKIYEIDERVRDLETSRSLYRLFLKKSEAGEQWFKNSPLKKKAAADLAYIEKKHFRMD